MCVLIVKPESWFTAKNIAELEGYKHIGFQEWIGLEVLEQALALSHSITIFVIFLW